MANKNSKVVSQKMILSKLQEADNTNIMHIDKVDMQRSLSTIKKPAINTKQVQNNQKVLKVTTILNKINGTVNADGNNYNNGSYGKFDENKKNYDEMTETDKTFAAMDALIAQDPLDDDEEIITPQEVLDGANGKKQKPDIKGEGGATIEDVKETVLAEIENTKDTTPSVEPNKKEDKEESGVKAFYNKYKVYILVAIAAIVIYLIAKKKD